MRGEVGKDTAKKMYLDDFYDVTHDSFRISDWRMYVPYLKSSKNWYFVIM